MADGAAVRRPDSPYPGARPFARADKDLFFGRGPESRALAEFWQDNRIVLAVGPAASGKTSLLNAGVLPIMERTRVNVLPPGNVSHGLTFPAAALPEHNPYTLALLRSWSPGEGPARLVDLTVRDFIRTRARAGGGPICAAIDQTDDLLADSGARRDYRDRFLTELADAVAGEPRLHLLLLAREDAAALISSRLRKTARFDVTALTREGAVDAVAGPAAGTGRTFDAGAAERLVTDLQASHITMDGGLERLVEGDLVEPSLLQAVCVRLWEALPREAACITVRDVRLFGDVDSALREYCGRVIAAVADDFDKRVGSVRQWLLRAFITDLGTRGRVHEGVGETAGVPNAMARALEDRHLLSTEPWSGSRWYELLADRLIQPLRDAADELPPAVDPAQYLTAAERSLARGEVGVARRYAAAALRYASGTNLRLHAQIESFLGNAAAESGDSVEAKAEAESHYRAAARLFEALGDTAAVASQLAAVGQVLLAQERRDAALDELKAAVDRMPGDPVLQTDLALALWGMGEGRAAVSVLTAVLAVDGGNTLALRARGEILAELGQAREAISDLDRVTLRERPSTRAARGLALAALGDKSGANKEIADAIAEAPLNGAVLFRAAKAKSLNGDEYAAEELARRAVDASDPGLPPHYRELALLLAERKHANSRQKLAPGARHRPVRTGRPPA